tara:strand:- start:501 stop:1088 length:588 start_codon:yes stop_codon:yes gene_type:complete
MLMDMQHRDITPEDYDMLTRLDSSVQPKTLSPRVLDKRAPSWCVPEASSSEEEMPLPPGAVCPPVPTGSSPDDADAVASSMSELSLSSRSRSLSSRLSGQQCSICMEDLSAGERVRKLPCGHIFHASCVDEWLTRRSNVCPDDGLPVRPKPSRIVPFAPASPSLPRSSRCFVQACESFGRRGVSILHHYMTMMSR